MTYRLFLSFAVLLLSLVGGCSYKLTDSVDLELNFAPLVGPSSALHSPYVQGARFSIYLQADGQASRPGSGWRIESDHPSVLTVENTVVSQSSDEDHWFLSASVWARGEGATSIVVRNGSGDEVIRAPIEVLQPDRIELLWHGALLVGRPENESAVSDIRVVQNGTATLLARYFLGERQLSGHGVLSAVPVSGVQAKVRKTFLFEDRDWLSVTPSGTDPLIVDLFADGVRAGRISVRGVPASDIVSIRLSESQEARERAKDGDLLVVLAEGLDRQGITLFGTEPRWQFAGSSTPGSGDLFRYEYKSGMQRMLTASLGSMSSSLMIESKGGHVDSTNNIGCASAPARSRSAAPVGMVALLLTLTLMLRRRARRSIE